MGGRKKVEVFRTNYITGKRLKIIGFIVAWIFKHLVTKAVTACVDVALLRNVKEEKTERTEMLLGRRTRNPAKHWFVIGGRMWRGELFEEAAVRNLKRELGLIINNIGRFSHLVTNNYLWDTSAQSKTEGSHTVGVTMVITLTEEEVATITPNDEYSELKWVPISKVFMDERYHPAVRNIALKAMYHQQQKE